MVIRQLFSIRALALWMMASTLLWMGCRPTRHLEEGELLLTRTKIESDNKQLDNDALNTFVRQKPNNRLLGLRVNLALYNFAHKGKEGWLKRKIKQGDAAEAPVVWAESKSNETAFQLSKHLADKGYFQNNTWFTADTVGRKKNKIQVTYHITTGKPYLFGKVSLATEDPQIVADARKVFSSARNPSEIKGFSDEVEHPDRWSKRVRKKAKRDKNFDDKVMIWPGRNYDVDALLNERKEFAWGMRNAGYYKFNQQHVQFEMDSLGGDRTIHVKEIVRNPYMAKKSVNDTDFVRHEKYYIRDIYVIPDYHSGEIEQTRDTLEFEGFKFLYNQELNYQPHILTNAIFIRRGLYSLFGEEFTYKRITGMKSFRFIDISYAEIEAVGDTNLLDCYIRLTPAPKQSFTIASDLTHRSSNLGVSGNLTYQNRNVFHGAEMFQMQLHGGVEGQKTVGQTSEESSIISTSSNSLDIFNTFEYGVETSLSAPRLILANQLTFLPRIFDPSTKASAQYNFQSRPDYRRIISSLSYDYNWQDIRRRFHTFTPLDFSLVKIEKSDSFQALLDELSNAFLKNSYTDHFILSNRYGFSYTNQNVNKLMPFYYFKTSFENAGNLLRLAHDLAGATADSTGSYNLLDVQFAQYIRSDMEFIYNEPLTKKMSMVYRGFAGIGVPLKNFTSLPFEKSFFSGGANGIRAWTARSLGPGISQDTTSVAFDKIGNVKLEFNAEFRFDILKSLEGALFMEAGNIWSLEEDTEHPGGKFEFKNFYKAMALGGGAGLRIDFSFFIIRMDTGIKLYDPGIVEGERWFYQSKDATNVTLANVAELRGNDFRSYGANMVVWNLGIGYPF